MSEPVLEVKGLGCGYRDLLVADLDFRLASGESLAVVGPNGVGKTTVLRTLAGLIKPLAGEIRVQGTDLAQLGPTQRARQVTILSQDDLGDGTLTVRELVELGRTPHLGPWGRLGSADQEAVEQALTACHLTELANQRLDRISGGERQRARIAMTVAQQTALLLLDEPVNHLDLKRRFEFFELLGALRRERGLATLMVLHDLVEAYRESERVLVLTDSSGIEVPAADPERRQKLAEAFGVPEDRVTT